MSGILECVIYLIIGIVLLEIVRGYCNSRGKEVRLALQLICVFGWPLIFVQLKFLHYAYVMWRGPPRG